MARQVVQIIQTYFDGFMMRFSIKTYTTKWVPLEVGITISSSLFVLAMQLLLNAVGSNVPKTHLGEGMYMPSLQVKKAVQQSQQGRWNTWEEVVQRSISWNEIWKMSPYRLAFVIRSIYDQLPYRNHFLRCQAKIIYKVGIFC